MVNKVKKQTFIVPVRVSQLFWDHHSAVDSGNDIDGIQGLNLVRYTMFHLSW